MFNWDAPALAADGDSAFMYVIYHFDNENPAGEDFADPKNILDITSQKFYLPAGTRDGYYAVSALDRNHNEGEASPLITVSAPEKPLLAFPENNALNQRDTVMLTWQFNDMTSLYRVQVSLDSMFGTFLYNRPAVSDTFFNVTNMSGKTDYYWRVSGENPAGSSDFSDINKYTTGFPVAPFLAEPVHTTLDIPLDAELKWHETADAQKYRIQVGTDISFSSTLIVLDTTVISDTTLVATNLEPNLIHFWRVAAGNQYGLSQWSESWGFKTTNVTGFEEYAEAPNTFYLKQNYPNPFNATTHIEFSIVDNGRATLVIYDVRGKMVEKVVDRYFSQGVYTIEFDASHLASGMYIYQIVSGKHRLTRKMLLIK
jgi:hypothetical protein